ncbi:hypothetical protein IU450_36185 [Nocardia abscessus]|uniref:hypothetical protein n=1 Tax=Nocardia abscessus TaxID=120957 RepID=UPI001894B0EE|nr:hypothetical protein [Nocardia abscessus]MBF6341282.1 hypothetical protein [Nocardia abscessus]
MPELIYDRDRITAKLNNGGTMAEIAQRLEQWQPTDNHNGLVFVRDLIDAAPCDLWRLDIEDVALVVFAAFSCDEDGFLIHNGELTLSMMVDDLFQVSDPGLTSIHDLTDLTELQDGRQRLFALVDAITDRLNAVLTLLMRFSRRRAHPRADETAPSPSLSAGDQAPPASSALTT